MTKASKRFVCTVCNTKKSPTAFLSRTSTVCSACEAEKQAPEPVPELPAPSPLVTETIASEAPFKHVDVEVDPANPTAREMAARTLARRRLLPFIKRFRPKYDAGWVHEDICRRLERFVEQVELGQSPRLLLMMPVRTGKSEIASRHFAPWVLGKHPDWEIIAASGAQSLAMSFSRYIRDLVRDPSYQAVFSGMRLDPSSQSVENWNTTSGGGYLAAGTGSMITGRGAHCLIIDDPVKDAEAADSQVIRDATWEWYMCFHPETEVLTVSGWKPVGDVRVGEPVATMDVGNGEMYYQPATQTQRYPYNGELVDVMQRSGVSFRVTPNHSVFSSWGLNSPLRKHRADEIPPHILHTPVVEQFSRGIAPATDRIQGTSPAR